MAFDFCISQSLTKKQVVYSSQWLFAQVFVCFMGCFPAPWGSLDKTFLDQERLVYFFKGARFFANSRGNGGDAHRSPLEFFNDGRKNAVVHVIKPMLINI